MSEAPVTAAFPHHHVPIARSGGPRQAIPLELAAPLALGQRGLVVAPPRTGATSVLRWLGDALVAAVPDMELRVLLVDRPVEEHTEWREEVPGASVFGTSSDAAGPEEHVALTSAFDEAAAHAAAGRHVAVLVDSLGSLARALAATMDAADGRVLDGGLPQLALRELRRLFGLARAGAPGDAAAGSLTILATVQAETAQQLDEVILHELVGTGNVEWRLDAEAMQAGLFPPVDVLASGARRSELILGEAEADRRALLRAWVDERGTVAGLGMLVAVIDEHFTLDGVLDWISASASAAAPPDPFDA
ncbi:MAG: putative transcription termination factor [Thermoleophilia bacterium]|nr:putative transcription termination factor [Thermoleophilia bacterium]